MTILSSRQYQSLLHSRLISASSSTSSPTQLLLLFLIITQTLFLSSSSSSPSSLISSPLASFANAQSFVNGRHQFAFIAMCSDPNSLVFSNGTCYPCKYNQYPAFDTCLDYADWPSEKVATDLSKQVDNGQSALLFVANAAVCMMTVAISLFYSGLSTEGSIMNTVLLTVVSFSITQILWVLLGYSIAFGPGNEGWGNADWGAFTRFVTRVPSGVYGPNVPHVLFATFQGMFCACTASIISGSVIQRFSFRAYMVYCAIWTLVVYAPIARWAWALTIDPLTGDTVPLGWLGKLGFLDTAGGLAVHICSGFSSLAATLVVGRRLVRQDTKPDVTRLVTSICILWGFWFFFNGATLILSGAGTAAECLANTHLSACMGLLIWCVTEYLHTGKVSFVGAMTSVLIGLVSITAGSGYISNPLLGSLIGGMTAFSAYWFNILKTKYLSSLLDDTLDVFLCHGFSGAVGTILVGFFADDNFVAGPGTGGLISNRGILIGYQLAGVVAGAAYSFTMTAVICLALKYTIGIRVTEEEEILGLDRAHEDVPLVHDSARAPKDEETPFAVIFCDIEKSGRLFAKEPMLMTRVVDLTMKAIIRVCEKYDSLYLVKNLKTFNDGEEEEAEKLQRKLGLGGIDSYIDDTKSFEPRVIVTENPAHAIRFAVEIQNELDSIDWGEDVIKKLNEMYIKHITNDQEVAAELAQGSDDDDDDDYYFEDENVMNNPNSDSASSMSAATSGTKRTTTSKSRQKLEQSGFHVVSHHHHHHRQPTSGQQTMHSAMSLPDQNNLVHTGGGTSQQSYFQTFDTNNSAANLLLLSGNSRGGSPQMKSIETPNLQIQPSSQTASLNKKGSLIEQKMRASLDGANASHNQMIRTSSISGGRMSGSMRQSSSIRRSSNDLHSGDKSSRSMNNKNKNTINNTNNKGTVGADSAFGDNDDDDDDDEKNNNNNVDQDFFSGGQQRYNGVTDNDFGIQQNNNNNNSPQNNNDNNDNHNHNRPRHGNRQNRLKTRVQNALGKILAKRQQQHLQSLASAGVEVELGSVGKSVFTQSQISTGDHHDNTNNEENYSFVSRNHNNNNNNVENTCTNDNVVRDSIHDLPGDNHHNLINNNNDSNQQQQQEQSTPLYQNNSGDAPNQISQTKKRSFLSAIVGANSGAGDALSHETQDGSVTVEFISGDRHNNRNNNNNNNNINNDDGNNENNNGNNADDENYNNSNEKPHKISLPRSGGGGGGSSVATGASDAGGEAGSFIHFSNQSDSSAQQHHKSNQSNLISSNNQQQHHHISGVASATSSAASRAIPNNQSSFGISDSHQFNNNNNTSLVEVRNTSPHSGGVASASSQQKNNSNNQNNSQQQQQHHLHAGGGESSFKGRRPSIDPVTGVRVSSSSIQNQNAHRPESPAQGMTPATPQSGVSNNNSNTNSRMNSRPPSLIINTSFNTNSVSPQLSSAASNTTSPSTENEITTPLTDQEKDKNIRLIREASKFFKGIRLRVAVHYGRGVPSWDATNQCFSYGGIVVEAASIIRRLGHGGQNLISKFAWDHAVKMDSSIKSSVVALNLGELELRRFRGSTMLFQVLPKELASRKFPPLRPLLMDLEESAIDSDEEDEDERFFNDYYYNNTRRYSTASSRRSGDRVGRGANHASSSKSSLSDSQASTQSFSDGAGSGQRKEYVGIGDVLQGKLNQQNLDRSDNDFGGGAGGVGSSSMNSAEEARKRRRERQKEKEAKKKQKQENNNKEENNNEAFNPKTTKIKKKANLDAAVVFRPNTDITDAALENSGLHSMDLDNLGASGSVRRKKWMDDDDSDAGGDSGELGKRRGSFYSNTRGGNIHHGPSRKPHTTTPPQSKLGVMNKNRENVGFDQAPTSSSQQAQPKRHHHLRQHSSDVYGGIGGGGGDGGFVGANDYGLPHQTGGGRRKDNNTDYTDYTKMPPEASSDDAEYHI